MFNFDSLVRKEKEQQEEQSIGLPLPDAYSPYVNTEGGLLRFYCDVEFLEFDLSTYPPLVRTSTFSVFLPLWSTYLQSLARLNIDFAAHYSLRSSNPQVQRISTIDSLAELNEYISTSLDEYVLNIASAEEEAFFRYLEGRRYSLLYRELRPWLDNRIVTNLEAFPNHYFLYLIVGLAILRIYRIDADLFPALPLMLGYRGVEGKISVYTDDSEGIPVVTLPDLFDRLGFDYSPTVHKLISAIPADRVTLPLIDALQYSSRTLYSSKESSFIAEAMRCAPYLELLCTQIPLSIVSFLSSVPFKKLPSVSTAILNAYADLRFMDDNYLNTHRESSYSYVAEDFFPLSRERFTSILAAIDSVRPHTYGESSSISGIPAEVQSREEIESIGYISQTEKQQLAILHAIGYISVCRVARHLDIFVVRTLSSGNYLTTGILAADMKAYKSVIRLLPKIQNPRREA